MIYQINNYNLTRINRRLSKRIEYIKNLLLSVTNEYIYIASFNFKTISDTIRVFRIEDNVIYSTYISSQ